MIKRGLSSLASLKPLYHLYQTDIRVNGYSQKIFWHILQDRHKNKANQLDYLIYLQNQLIGSFHFFIFSDHNFISFILDPYKANIKIINKILQRVLKSFSMLNINHCIISSTGNDHLINKIIKQRQWHIQKNVLEYIAPSSVSSHAVISDLLIEQAQLQDINALAEINYQCFKQQQTDDIVKNYKIHLNNQYRKIFVLKNTDHKIIGKLHCKEEIDQIVIHDIGILPDYQQKGFGKYMLLKWLQHHSKKYDKPIMVEVDSENSAAIRLYESCQFEIRNTFKYYHFTEADIASLALEILAIHE